MKASFDRDDLLAVMSFVVPSVDAQTRSKYDTDDLYKHTVYKVRGVDPGGGVDGCKSFRTGEKIIFVFQETFYCRGLTAIFIMFIYLFILCVK